MVRAGGPVESRLAAHPNGRAQTRAPEMGMQHSACEPIFVFMQEVLGPHCAAAETCDVKPRRFLLGQLVQPTCQGVDPGRKPGLVYCSLFALCFCPPPPQSGRTKTKFRQSFGTGKAPEIICCMNLAPWVPPKIITTPRPICPSGTFRPRKMYASRGRSVRIHLTGPVLKSVSSCKLWSERQGDGGGM